MREVEIDLGGKSLTLAATFGAAMKLAEKVADPLLIAREAALEATMIARGINYDPRFKFSVANVPLVLWIGAQAAGSKAKLEDVQEMVFDAGFVVARDAAVDYIALIVRPQSEEVTSGGEASGE